MCEITQHPILDTVAYWILSLTLGLSHATDQGSILLILMCHSGGVSTREWVMGGAS